MWLFKTWTNIQTPHLQCDLSLYLGVRFIQFKPSELGARRMRCAAWCTTVTHIVLYDSNLIYRSGPHKARNENDSALWIVSSPTSRRRLLDPNNSLPNLNFCLALNQPVNTVVSGQSFVSRGYASHQRHCGSLSITDYLIYHFVCPPSALITSLQRSSILFISSSSWLSVIWSQASLTTSRSRLYPNSRCP